MWSIRMCPKAWPMGHTSAIPKAASQSPFVRCCTHHVAMLRPFHLRSWKEVEVEEVIEEALRSARIEGRQAKQTPEDV